MKELFSIVKRQIEGRHCFEKRVSNLEKRKRENCATRESAEKHVDVKGMRLVANNRCTAEQIKNDKAENVVMDGSEVGQGDKVKSVVMVGPKVGEFEKLAKNKN